jgi:hypothetical protein
MTHFVAQFTLDNLAVFDGQHCILARASKMLANSRSIVCDEGNFHDFLQKYSQ